MNGQERKDAAQRRILFLSGPPSHIWSISRQKRQQLREG